MPANLNALIRYRTIDKCLANPYRKWTIEDLTEACSKALEESRGIYTGISERTIREDIRVMRSDILGFNAPIVQKDGNYTYEDKDYSIFKVIIRDAGLLSRILDFMLEIRSEVNHPDMDRIIENIAEAISMSGTKEDISPALSAPESPQEKRQDLEEATFLLSETKETYTSIAWGWILEKIDPLIESGL